MLTFTQLIKEKILFSYPSRKLYIYIKPYVQARSDNYYSSKEKQLESIVGAIKFSSLEAKSSRSGPNLVEPIDGPALRAF